MGTPRRGRTLTWAEQAQVRRAAGVLVGRGLLALEDDPLYASVRVGGRGYRYVSQFWTLTGVLEAKSVRLQDDREVARARRRIAAEWIRAGAPPGWAEREAAAAVGLFRGWPGAAARPKRSEPEPESERASATKRRPRRRR